MSSQHRMRLGASVFAAAAVAVVVPLTGAPHGGNHVPHAHHGTARAVLSGCAAANPGQLGAGWQAEAIAHAGPLWFLDGGHSRGRLRLYASIVVLDGVLAGARVTVRAAGPDWGALRFLYGPADTMNAGTRYTMRSGEGAVTFAACASGGVVTSYVGGFLVRGARCVPAQVWLPRRARPEMIRLGVCSPH